MKHALSECVGKSFVEGDRGVLYRLGERNDEVRLAILNLLCTFVQVSVKPGVVESTDMEDENVPVLMRLRSSTSGLNLEGLLNQINGKLGELFSKPDVSQ